MKSYYITAALTVGLRKTTPYFKWQTARFQHVSRSAHDTYMYYQMKTL